MTEVQENVIIVRYECGMFIISLLCRTLVAAFAGLYMSQTAVSYLDTGTLRRSEQLIECRKGETYLPLEP